MPCEDTPRSKQMAPLAEATQGEGVERLMSWGEGEWGEPSEGGRTSEQTLQGRRRRGGRAGS